MKSQLTPRGDFPHYAGMSWRIALALVMAVVALALHTSPAFTLIENALYDWRVRDSSTYEQVSDRIVVIGVDDKSLGRLAPEGGPWPWPRTMLAKILRYCEQADAVGVEILLSEHRHSSDDAKSGDADLIRDIGANSNVILAVHFTQGVSDTKAIEQLESMSISAQQESLEAFPVHAGVMAPFSELLASCQGIGHINLVRDEDGVVRSYRALAAFRQRLYPSLAVSLVAEAMDLAPSDIHLTPAGALRMGDLELPLDREGDFLFLPCGLPFRYYSAADVIRSCDEASDGGEPAIAKDAFKNRIVLIGMTASTMGGHEHLSTTPDAAGITIVASALKNILERKCFRRPSGFAVAGIMFLMAVVPALPGLRRGRVLALSGLAVLGLYLATAVIASQHLVMLPITGPVLAAGLSCIGLGTLYVAENKARRKYVQTMDSAKQQLTDMLVHDLKNTVMPITMALAMRSQSFNESSQDEDTREFWKVEFPEIVAVSTNKLMTQINALMDIRRMQRGHLQLKPASHDPARLLQDVETQYRLSVERAELGMMCNTSLPDNARVSVDAEVFGRMMGNMLWNAVAHAARGSTIEVGFRSSTADGVTCYVSCPGRVIPNEEQNHLFVAFASAASVEPPPGKISNSALGLTFCKLAMEAHGGTITLHSPRPNSEDGIEVSLHFAPFST